MTGSLAALIASTVAAIIGVPGTTGVASVILVAAFSASMVRIEVYY